MYAIPNPTLKNATGDVTADDLRKADEFWIRQAQQTMMDDFRSGKYKNLGVRQNESGVLVTSGRFENWMLMTYDEQELILLPSGHRFARLYGEHIHSLNDSIGMGAKRRNHLGVSSTICKIRKRFWITNITKMVKSIRFH